MINCGLVGVRAWGVLWVVVSEEGPEDQDGCRRHISNSQGIVSVDRMQVCERANHVSVMHRQPERR